MSLKTKVFTALTNAQENGYWLDVDNQNVVTEIAEDLVTCDADLEDADVEMVEVFVKHFFRVE